MCEWKSKYGLKYRCRVRPEPGDDLCILHQTGNKDTDRFKKILYAQLDEEGSAEERNPCFDFRGYHFPLGISTGMREERDVREEILVPPKMTNIELSEAIIAGDALFKNASIEGCAHLEGTEVKGTLAFLSVGIEGDAEFAGTTIRGNARFSNTRIGGRIASFSRVTIEGELSFDEVEIRGNIHLDRAKIAENATFRFNQPVGILHCRDCEIGNTLDLASPDALIIGSVDFNGCTAKHLYVGYGRPSIRGWGKARCGILIEYDYGAPSFWRFAQRVFDSEGKGNESDASFYFERVARWRALRARRAKGLTVGRQIRNAVMRWVYMFLWFLDCVFLRWPTAYGASLARLFVTWGILVGIFAALFLLLSESGLVLFDQTSPGLEYAFSFGRSLYFSVITFTTLGYGDIRPAPGLGSALCATEAILGGIMMALTVLVIGRKFMR